MRAAFPAPTSPATRSASGADHSPSRTHPPATSSNARQNSNGGSDYYEGGYANPDVILADLVKIFHPDLLPDHDLYFYKQIPAK